MIMTTLALTLSLSGGAASLPADAAENPRPVSLGGGAVAPGADGSVSVEALLAVLKADAARRAGARAITAGPVEEVVWSDGALGCPQPGLAYTQALVPGWRVRFDVAGAAPLTYHASRRGQWLLCPAGRAGAPLPAGVAR